MLNIRFVDHLFDDMLIENVEVRESCPRCVQAGALHTYPVKRENRMENTIHT